MARIMRDATGGGPEASAKPSPVEEQTDSEDSDLVFDDPEVDIEPEAGELQIDDLIYEDNGEETSEPDIIEEVELPSHMLSQESPSQPPPLQGAVKAPPLPPASVKPPASWTPSFVAGNSGANSHGRRSTPNDPSPLDAL